MNVYAFSRARVATAFLAIFGATLLNSQAAHAESYRIVVNDHAFSPAHITAHLNQPVTITIVNKGTKTHNFILPAFYIFTANLPAKKTTNVGFSPDKKGSYPFFSDTGGSKEPGLSGEIEVK